MVSSLPRTPRTHGSCWKALAIPLSLLLWEPAHAATLVINGGFELPNIATGTNSITNAVPGWTRDAGLSTGTGIEIQDNFKGAPYEGNQHCELDSDGVTAIYQDLTTVNGQTYTLSFAFSPRPKESKNIMNVYWGSTLVVTLDINGAPNNDTVWQLYTYQVTAIGTTTRLRFDNLTERSDGAGSYLDAVEVSDVPEPGGVALTLSAFVFGSVLWWRQRGR